VHGVFDILFVVQNAPGECLDLPPIAMLRDKLIDGGMNIPADVITAEELAEAICPLK